MTADISAPGNKSACIISRHLSKIKRHDNMSIFCTDRQLQFEIFGISRKIKLEIFGNA